MVDILHVDDAGTIIYIDITDDGESLDTMLDSFSTRNVHIRRAKTDESIVIVGVPTEVDPLDNIKKLKIITGTDDSVSLTNTGLFKLPSTCPGIWVAEIALADMGWSGISDTFELFELRPNLI